MGNQQTLTYNYYSFAENDSDSGFGELSSSPFELNKNTSFNYLYETNEKDKTRLSLEQKQILANNSSQNEHNITNNNNNNTLLTKRNNSLVKSKSIGINIINNRKKENNSYQNDSFDLDSDTSSDICNHNSSNHSISVSFFYVCICACVFERHIYL